jgi:hypothetical protein
MEIQANAGKVDFITILHTENSDKLSTAPTFRKASAPDACG